MDAHETARLTQLVVEMVNAERELRLTLAKFSAMGAMTARAREEIRG